MVESSNSKILIAEDSQTQAIRLKIVLKNEGYAVTHAKDGREAVTFLEQETLPDIVITDVMMPEMDGFELTKHIKTNKKFKDIPVLMLTSLTDKTDVIKGLASGAEMFITKPFVDDHLVKTVKDMLQHKDLEPEITEILNGGVNQAVDKTTIRFLLSAYQTAINNNIALEKSKDNLLASNENLENTVKERTEELERAKKKAEKSDQLKSIFLSNVSHDLRTPMNAIIGFSELLKEESFEPENRAEYLDLIMKNGENLLGLIDDIIDISKIEAGVIKCNKDINCEVNPLMKDLEKSFKQYKYLKHREVELFFSRETTRPNLVTKTDPFRLKQILSNLLSNAVKFTKKGQIEFSYEVINDEILQFYVKDTGIGIPEDKQEDLFQRFEQVKTSDSPSVGTGLGLAISKSLVNLLGGKIWIESELGEGTTFYFTLPYIPSEEPAIEYFPEVKKNPWSVDLEGKLILIVEDDMSNFNYLKAVLKKVNAQIKWARNGEEALEVFDENPDIAVVLMDINLPKMTGFEATRRMVEKNRDIPIIAQTAYAMSGDEQKCYDAGCSDYMAKPIKPAILLSKIEKNLNH